MTLRTVYFATAGLLGLFAVAIWLEYSANRASTRISNFESLIQHIEMTEVEIGKEALKLRSGEHWHYQDLTHLVRRLRSRVRTLTQMSDENFSVLWPEISLAVTNFSKDVENFKTQHSIERNGRYYLSSQLEILMQDGRLLNDPVLVGDLFRLQKLIMSDTSGLQVQSDFLETVRAVSRRLKTSPNEQVLVLANTISEHASIMIGAREAADKSLDLILSAHERISSPLQSVSVSTLRNFEAAAYRTRLGAVILLVVCGLMAVLICGLFGVLVRETKNRRDRNIVLEEMVSARTEELNKRRAEAEAANIAQGQFLATMSHEIRTPMNGIVGMIDLLARGALSDKQHSYLDIARDAASDLMTIINDVLDYSKLEADQVEIEKVPCSISSIVQEKSFLMAAEAEQKGITLTTRIDPDLPAMVIADPTRIKQVLINLLSNAIKFTSDGGVHVVVSYNSGASEPLVRFEITDTGIGIRDEQKGNLFERFVQADSSTTRKFGGTGLGLAICKQLVGLMDGKIGLDSQFGKGSTFWFELPVRAAEACPTSVTVTESGVDAYRDVETPKILVVEDNTTNQKVVLSFLESMGWETVPVSNGAEALARVQAEAFDVILMDIQMPVMDGVTATRAIRALPSPIREIPIIALTANVSPDAREKYLSEGMDEYIAKPINRQTLLKTIGTILQASTQLAATNTPAKTDEPKRSMVG